MRTGSRTNRGAGLTLTEVVVLTIILAVLAGTLLPAVARHREENRRIRCRNNLNLLVKGMATYWNENADSHSLPCPLGRGRNPGTYNGAEWLAALYWTWVVPDPRVFVCPSSGDSNREGIDIGSYEAATTFGSQTVSYAGMHYPSRPGASMIALSIRDYPFRSATTPMASDDTQGDINHGTLRNGGMNVLFFDSHVEFKTHTELDLKRAVGQEGGLLEELRN